MKKKFSIAAVLLAVAMAITGCSDSILESKVESGTESKENIWTAADTDIVAFPTADGLTEEQKKYYNITFEEFYKEYSFICANAGLDDTKENASAQLYRQSIIEMIASEKIILKKAEELGLAELTADEMKKVEEEYQKNLDGWYNTFSAQAQNELGIKGDSTTSDTSGSLSDDDKAKIKEKSKELFNNYIKNFGLTEDTFLIWAKNSFIVEKVMEYTYKDVKVNDDEVDKYINDLIAEAEKTYKEDVSKYEKTTQYGTVWLPEGSRNVKHVFIGISTIDAAEISAARNESGANQEEIDKLRDEKLAEIKEKAEAAYKKATAESDDKEKNFDAVLKEYSHDYNASLSDQTITVIKGTKSLTDTLYNAIFELEKPGDISALIPTDLGYYFFYYKEDAKITDEDITVQKKNVYEGMLTERQNEKADETLTKWEEEVKYDYDYEKLNFEKPEEEDTSSK
ncbi:MAG: peptidyl-prolyl cis-trans isomerase [Ruminiclostridium sp.]|nr:peptidyl-prolyl cis-trans isomerase [Ruminiclostridium sp.]